ncbi:unnamed protein product [Cladocopium goreaui]|uniref:Uncharacterized protein n=1 Tax=Cladocopium goreaui TaxID=2562237 RepID=A0A9P1GDD2_9DINO|nr:unnamed protein product [Cladocopium goreaui]
MKVFRRDLRTSPKTRWLCGPALCWRPHFHSKGEQLSEVSKIGCTRKTLRMYRRSKSFLDSQDGKKIKDISIITGLSWHSELQRTASWKPTRAEQSLATSAPQICTV